MLMKDAEQLPAESRVKSRAPTRGRRSETWKECAREREREGESGELVAPPALIIALTHER